MDYASKSYSLEEHNGKVSMAAKLVVDGIDAVAEEGQE